MPVTIAYLQALIELFKLRDAAKASANRLSDSTSYDQLMEHGKNIQAVENFRGGLLAKFGDQVAEHKKNFEAWAKAEDVRGD